MVTKLTCQRQNYLHYEQVVHVRGNDRNICKKKFQSNTFTQSGGDLGQTTIKSHSIMIL